MPEPDSYFEDRDRGIRISKQGIRAGDKSFALEEITGVHQHQERRGFGCLGFGLGALGILLLIQPLLWLLAALIEFLQDPLGGFVLFFMSAIWATPAILLLLTAYKLQYYTVHRVELELGDRRETLIAETDETVASEIALALGLAISESAPIPPAESPS